MFEVLTIGDNPYCHHKIRNKDYKERMRFEFEEYMEDTANKPWDADILRCGEPENIPEFKVNREPFTAVVKVMKSCWDIEPRDRPKFKSLVASLESLRNDYDYD